MAKANTDDFPVSPDSYEFFGRIGKGAFAKVYVAQEKKSKQKVAIKVIEMEPDTDDYDDESDNKDDLREIQKEAGIMHQLKHANVVTCFASFVVKDELWLVMPFLAGGSCADLMRCVPAFKNGFRDEAILSTILRDVMLGVEYCHNDGRIHRDVKARNILLSESGIAMLADFGVSGALVEGGLRKRGRNTLTGTPCWMAPEVMSKQSYNHKADIWSVGVTALELAFGQAPYEKMQPFKVMMSVMDGPPPTVDSMGDNNYSKSFKAFVRKCLQKETEKRPTAKDLLSTSFLKQAKSHDYIAKHVIKPSAQYHTITSKPIPEQPLSLQPDLHRLKSRRVNMKVTDMDNQEADKGGKQQQDKDAEEEDSYMSAEHSIQFKYSASLTDVANIIQEEKEKEEKQTKQKKGRFTIEPVDESEDDDADTGASKPNRFVVS